MIRPQPEKQFTVLWIAFVFPPYGGTQGAWMAKYLEQIGRLFRSAVRVDVLTIKPDGNFPQYDSTLEQYLDPALVTVHRLPNGFFHRFRLRPRRPARAHRWTSLADKMVQILSVVEWVPFGLIWILNRRLGHRRYDSVYVFVDPISSLLLALLAKRLNRCRLVLEYGDPWRLKPATLAKPLALRKLGESLEARAIRAADRIFVKTDAIPSEYAKLYPDLSPKKFDVLYGGVDWTEYDAIRDEKAAADFVICHTGLFYPDSVDPGPFLNAVKILIEKGLPIRLLLLGAPDPAMAERINRYGLTQQVIQLGHKPYREVIQYQKSASLLLAFGVNDRFKIPSKVAQYFAARKPILVIGARNEDPTASLVQRTGRGIAVPNDRDAIAQAIQKVFQLTRDGALSQHFDFRTVEEFSYSSISRAIMQALVPELK